MTTVLIFGAILGTLLGASIFYTVNLLYTNPDFIGNDVVGYAVMVVIFSLTFFGVRNYRNRELKGEISFGQAFKVGALIVVIGATMYVVVWLFYFYLVVPDFIDQYTAHVLKHTNATELASKKEQMERFGEMYKNPVFVVLITYSEVLPVGLIVALVSSLILKKKHSSTSAQ